MTIFGVGLFELLIIVVVALVVVGPERLPELMGALGRWTKRARELTVELRNQARSELGEDYDYVQQQVRTLRDLNPRRQIQELTSSLLDDPAVPPVLIRPPEGAQIAHGTPEPPAPPVEQHQIADLASATLSDDLLDIPLEQQAERPEV